MPHEVKDSRTRLFRGLRSPLARFVNRAKFFDSEEFMDMAELAAEVALTKSNYGYACELIWFFSGTSYQQLLARWLEAKCALEVAVGNDKIRIHKRAEATPRLVDPGEYFPAASRAVAERAHRARIRELESKGRVSLANPGSDLMDRGRRLPGSFEHGKRR